MNTYIIIYSKDRACQLDLLLRSIKIKFPNPGNIYVLYDFGNTSHEAGYNKVINKNYGMTTIFKRQTRETFYSVLKETVEESNSEFICPLCDDDVFIRSFDFEGISKHVTDDTIGVHLRFSKDLTISYHTGKTYGWPNFQSIDSPFIKWNWTEYPIIDRWGYPYQAGGLVYKKEFMKHMISNINFHLPNSFETQMMAKRHEWAKPIIVGFESSPIVNVSINRVQHEVNNRGGRDVNYDPNQLNDLFLSGKIIDYSKLDNYKNNCEFIEIPLDFIDE